jgi:signal transduction histidine kinase
MYYHGAAVDLYDKIGDNAGKAKALNHLSIDYKESGNYESAIAYAIKSKELLEATNQNDYIVYPLISLGNVYEELEQYEDALGYYQESYELSISVGNNDIAYTSLMNMGVIYFRTEEYESCLKMFQKVIEYYEKVHNKDRLILLYSNQSLVLNKLGHEAEAERSLEKSLQMARETNNRQKQIWALNNLGIQNKKQKKYLKAEVNYKESLRLAKQSGLVKDQAIALKNLSFLYEATGQLQRALDCHRRYKSIEDSLLNETKVKAIAELEAKYERKEAEARILQLENETAQQEITAQNIRLERNAGITTGIIIVVILAMGLVLYRLKTRKDKVIAGQKIQQLEDEKKLLAAQSVMVGQEKERQRVAQELHDSIGVLLSTAKIHFSNVVKNTSDEETLEMVRKADKLLSEAGEEVRDISHNMMPGVLSKFGLNEAIEDLLDEVSDSGILEVSYNVEELTIRLPEDHEIMLYRVIQELVNNTLKYAAASRIIFSLKKTENHLLIEYTDDGKGFDESNIAKSKSLGISGIRSRIDFLDGTLSIDSRPGQGATFHIEVPINQTT